MDDCNVSGAVHREALPLHARFDRAIDGLQKMIAVVLHVEAYQVRAQQALEQFPLPGADPERFRIRPRDMPEDTDARVGATLLDHLRQEGEVIVLDDDRSEE